MTSLPVSTVPNPNEAPVLRWGILGPGWIADRFAESLAKNSTQQVVAVASRSEDRAAEFAGRHSLPKSYGSYDALLADPDIDVVYIATPHTEHHTNALASIAAGKHVLVEKPLAVDATRAAEIGAAAAEAGVFVGEAMWTKFLPKFDVLRQIVDSGVLGPIRTVLVDHGEYFTTDHRIYDPALAGGPLLDLGTYDASFIHTILGAPESITAVGQPANDELNGQVSAVLTHTGGNHSVMNTTILSNTPTSATICGRDGTLTVEGPFFMPGSFTVTLRDGETLEYREDKGVQVDGLYYAAVDAARAIGEGRLESSVHTIEDAVQTLAIIDSIRGQLGITDGPFAR
ncbi:Gfo/Idh/MocA family protein [Rhodococcoides fascians]|uniref:Gfo/Idh/MocA family protein n=1 Tax=Rhodococcoides fascians TaxID=1828 RepID=UPI00055B9E60|nr:MULTISPECIES: Gfo/Idh/MocA family oxidoreductase [Rhodococcus]OZD71949.1 gfo/Idh/MocA family oxidoreductase [Rhodococcus sp. 06-1059B-a]OZF09873.1 gfo/Idh/MocA family oxidoreductase [Rhodococcus sp. 15-1154-1]